MGKNVFKNLETLTSRAKAYLVDEVHPFWRDVICEYPQLNGVTFFLAAIYLRLSQLADLTSGANDFTITPFATAPGEPIRIVSKQMDGRTRRVVIWVDSAVGLPDPVMRVGTSRGSVNAGGLRVVPGGMNEIGRFPADKELYLSTDVALKVYVIEET